MDYLGALTPAANPLRMLEAAANGATIDSRAFWSGRNFLDEESALRNPRMRGQTEYRPTDRELVTQGLGFRPLRAAQLADAREAARERQQDRTKDAAYWLQQMILADRNGTPERVGDLARRARAAGVNLTQRRIVDTLKEARLERS